ncbi:MAG: transcriptional regulator [Nitrospirales bacterium]|nr:MAG: transcriptional regulator [Nitrospirales bacterium]
MSKDIGRKLRTARKAKGLTQKDLGAKMGLPQSHISQIEAGNVDVRFSSLQEMARLLDLEPILIPRPLLPAVRSIITGQSHTTKPAWLLDIETVDEEELS